MTVQKLLDEWTAGDAYRARVMQECDVKALSRYKIIGKPISGLYGLLKDEAFVLRLTLKVNPSDYQDVFVGNDAGPKLLGHANIPPCFNPLQAMMVGGRNSGASETTRGGRRFTPYNQELYDVINLFFIALRMDRTRTDGPISECLQELSEYGDRDLEPYRAKAMNSVMRGYKSNISDINRRLRDIDPNAREFDFPLIRQRLQKMRNVARTDILF